MAQRRNRDPGVFEEFNAHVQTMRQRWLEQGYTNEFFWSMFERNLRAQFEENLASMESDIAASLPNFKKKCGKILKSLILSILFVGCFYHVLFHIEFEDYIYPAMKFLRNLLIPVISLFPTLTGYYHGTCLLHNPFFAVSDMDCWPCSNVKNINEMQNITPSEQPNAPFIYKTEQVEITFTKLKDFYIKNKDHFDNEAPLIVIDDKSYVTPSYMISLQEFNEQHTFIWEFNNMNVAKLLRQIVPRPKIVPKFGQSIERFIIVDSSQEEFYIPDTECHNSFLLSLSGIRTVELEPAEECENQCKPLKIKIYPTFLLWYNWWYWRPVVLGSSGNTTFIAHSGSYC